MLDIPGLAETVRGEAHSETSSADAIVHDSQMGIAPHGAVVV
jgi:hypothetical protein